MQYHLAIKGNQSNYQLIKGFNDDSQLSSILDFTTSFEDCNSLLAFLKEAGFINPNLNFTQFKILFSKSKEDLPKVLCSGIPYQSEKKFLSVSYLITYYQEHMEDPEFSIPFLTTYYEYFKKNSFNAQTYLYYIRHYYVILPEYKDRLVTSDAPDISIAIKDFINSYCTRTSKKEKVIIYPRLLDLAKYAINYERNKTGRNPDEFRYFNEDLNPNQDIKQELQHYKVLLSTIDPNDERYNYYLDKIDSLNALLHPEDAELKLVRRCPNDITED